QPLEYRLHRRWIEWRVWGSGSCGLCAGCDWERYRWFDKGPSSLCGVVGLKPTYGRVSRYGTFPASWSLDHVGPIVRRVEDAAVMLMHMAERDAADPTTSDTRVPDYVGAIHREFRGLKVGVPRNHFFEG